MIFVIFNNNNPGLLPGLLLLNVTKIINKNHLTVFTVFSAHLVCAAFGISKEIRVQRKRVRHAIKNRNH